MVVGFGSDLSEEPAYQDVEPVTLESESFLGVLPNPPLSGVAGSFGIGGEVPVDDVGDPSLECSKRFFVGLAFGDFAFEVSAARRGGVAELGDRDHVDRPVQLTVPLRVEPMSFPVARRRLDRSGRVVRREVGTRREPADVTGLADNRRRADRSAPVDLL